MTATPDASTASSEAVTWWQTVAREITSRATAAAKTAPWIKQTFTYSSGLAAAFLCSNTVSPLLLLVEARMKWVADPILHGRVADTHLELCDGRRTRNIASTPDGIGCVQRPSQQPGSEVTALLGARPGWVTGAEPG
jgi:hypothetical protein